MPSTIIRRTALAAALAFLPATAAFAQQNQCAVPLDRSYDAFSASGDILGKVVSRVETEDGDVQTWVLQSDGPLFGLGGRTVGLPGDAVEIAAGRALVKIRDEETLATFPSFSC